MFTNPVVSIIAAQQPSGLLYSLLPPMLELKTNRTSYVKSFVTPRGIGAQSVNAISVVSWFGAPASILCYWSLNDNSDSNETSGFCFIAVRLCK